MSKSGRRSTGESAGVAAAQHDMIAAAGAGVASIGHEFVGAEPDLTGVLVKTIGCFDERPPASGWDGY